MLQGQSGSPGCQETLARREPVLPRHPVLTPIVLLSGAVVLGIASLSADNPFPILTMLGVPSFPLYLLLALVFGIAGTLASIISVIEYVDRYIVRAATFPKSKEHSYANRN
jgi:hypothetical protein